MHFTIHHIVRLSITSDRVLFDYGFIKIFLEEFQYSDSSANFKNRVLRLYFMIIFTNYIKLFYFIVVLTFLFSPQEVCIRRFFEFLKYFLHAFSKFLSFFLTTRSVFEILLKILSGFLFKFFNALQNILFGFFSQSFLQGHYTNHETDIRTRAWRMPKNFTGNWSDYERSRRWERSKGKRSVMHRGTWCHLGESHREEETSLPHRVSLPPSGRLSK